MNRLLTLILLGAALFVSLGKAYAQPTVYIEPDFVLIDSLEQTCIEFKTMDFTDLQEMRFTVRYNPEAVTLVDIPPASLNPLMTGLDIGDFFIDAVEGYVIFTWKVEDIPGCPPTDVTLADESVLFALCFEGIEGYSEITITDDPEDIYVTRLNSCPLDIGMFIDNGFIAVDNQPLTVNIPYVNANQGETICLDVTVEDFTDIVSFQFSTNWYPSVLNFVSVGAFGLPALSGSNFNVNQVDGWLTCSWYNPNPTQGLSVADGTAIFQICFEVTGNCGQTSPVSVTSDPTPIEIIFEGDEGIDVGVLNGDGAVTVNCFNPNGLSINLPDVSICPGESFCMDVTADNFDDLVGLQFSLNWNPDVIQFTNITNINTSLFTFDIADFNTAGANNGFLTVDWNDPSCLGETLADGTTLFTVCFMSVGGGDVNTTVAVSSNPMAIEVLDQCGGPNLPVNTFNGFVDVCELPGVVLIGENTTANPGDNVCVTIDVQQFEDVEELQFSVIWETSVLDYTGVSNFGLTGLSAANFDESNIGFGAICLTWTAPGGVGETLPDGTGLFDICFTAIGDPFECSAISFTEFPCLIDVVTGTSAGTNVGIEPVDGEVCMLNPFNFSVNPTSIDGFQGTIVCVDFEVTNFISFEQVAFSVNWNPDVLIFSSINSTTLTGFNPSSYDASNVSFGLLSVNWTEPVGNGLSLPNGASMFEICFIVTGDPGECSPISITGTPQPIIVIPDNSGGTNIGLVTVPGQICSSQFLSMASVDVTGVDCIGDNSGAIDITVTGGSGVYTYNWSGPGIVQPANEDQVNLPNGTYYVTVQDNVYGNLTLKDTIVVGFSANAPVADAGVDTTLPCGEVTMNLDGSGSSQGSQYEYEWQPLGGGFIAPGTENTLAPTIVGADDYQLAVTDLTSGCTIFDTITVEAATSPGVAITLSSNIDCQSDTVQLSGLGSTIGPQYTYHWSTLSGQLVPGNEDSLVTQAVAAGWYFFTVTNTQSGCGTTDSIEVLLDQVFPTAVAGPDLLLNCTENTGTLDGTGSSTGANIAYQWLDPDGEVLSSNLVTPVSEPGTYTLLVTNTGNFCQAADSAEVVADTTLPVVVTSISSKINCLADTITLLGEGSSTGPDFTYKWTGPGVIPTTETFLNALANLPGSYALEVTDNSNTCKAIAVVLVQKDTVPPVAEAGLPSSVTCTVNQAPLNGTGSSTGTPGQFTYLWTANPGSVLSGTETGLMATATSPGLYTLTVTRASNGCTASDTVSVLSNNDAPVASIATPDVLDCTNTSITLDATASSQGAGFQYTWAQASGPLCIDTSDPLMPVVGCANTFTLTVTNTANGCVSTASAAVVEDTIAPVAVALNTSWDCNDTEVQLDGTGSSQGAIYIYEWTSLGGGAITSGANTLTPTVNGPGTYGLKVTNTQNDCEATDIAQVAADTIPPFVDAGPDTEVTCLEPTTTLFGSAAPGVTYQWLFEGNPIPGGTNSSIIVDEAGTYTLQATSNTNGCVGSDDAIVNANDTPPVTDAGQDQDLGCEDDSVNLDGTGSDSGPTITYQWTTLDGLLDPGTVADPIAVAQEAGTYILTVNDQATGCSGTDTVVVHLVTGLPEATASFDGDVCDVTGLLMGNIPTGTTGLWTVNTSADIADPTNPNAEITNLAPGVNVATWTLSSPNCPNYSSATVAITVAGKPIANNDVAGITGEVESVEINLLANDLYQGISNYQLYVLPFAGPGSVEPENPLDGVVTYFASGLFAGTVEFQYALCNDDCPDLCDTAVVRVLIDKDIDLSETVPNGITPNGDGANETLFFDILEVNKERYPNNSLIIFNRWGDVVFQAAPYKNDWDGTSEDGPLPAGTYYYILRLDIDDSEIVRGDVTIVR